MEFHISRQSRDLYQFDQSLYSLSGNVIFANFHAVRVFVQKMNQRRDLVSFPEKAVKAGQVNAMGLIDEILHYVINLYERQKVSHVMEMAAAWIDEALGSEALDQALAVFTDEFPPLSVYRREQTVEEYLKGTTEGVDNRVIALEEMLMLWVANKNPALADYLELFDDDRLERTTGYLDVIEELTRFFDTQPKFGPDQQNLVEMLRAPAIAVPYSITAQLDFIRERWSELLGRYLYRLLTSLDLIKEEEKISFMGPGEIPVPVYDRDRLLGMGAEPENFSADREWMPSVVMIAKNTYVWLDQLSKKYRRAITHLDQIPDEELDLLAQRGYTGLWLIGLWERSRASAAIKQMMGNPDAIASAYSLYNYNIAWDLGGEDAYRDLRDRAWQRGIRLASDMVPNHMGIDSPWVLEHPERFISQDYSPFPSYSFNGPNLSADPRVGIYIEDHYFDKTDAAVVFKRLDHASGHTLYIFHGNDGTSMPWNDTAQLNYLNPETREAVIQTILEVARRFPIIRFDAAMTLAKRHYQRLWFPEPGSGGDIPSRAEHSMTRDQFDAAIPIEFWREVVDRVAAEVPDTLLLAEAFWLMEGYFVRTLGMHRVYNSAFMNLLRNEDNAKYRAVMKNTLEFDPEIMKRFVNFMNNPDERTAVDQFGKGDKYFGICVMMCTLPGLPMFGHGQIEGFAEKYGMEFRRPMWEEQPDPYLIERHEREIFPLLHRRRFFSGVENFTLFDFYSSDGYVNEDIFAYSNGLGSERNLVVYLNKFSSASGWVRSSVGFSVKTGQGDQRQVIQRSLGESLNLHTDENTFLIFKDTITGLEYIRPSRDVAEKGMFLELSAYKYFVFQDFREIQDDQFHSYGQLCNYLNGRGVPSIQEALRELMLQPVQYPFSQLANPGYFSFLYEARVTESGSSLAPHLLDEAAGKQSALLNGIVYLTGQNLNQEEILRELNRRLEFTLELPVIAERIQVPHSHLFTKAAEFLRSGLEDNKENWLVLFGWLFLHNLGKLAVGIENERLGGTYEAQTLSWIDEWQFNGILADLFQHMGIEETRSWRAISAIRLLINQQRWYQRVGDKPIRTILETWLGETDIQRFLGINRFKDVLWFNSEALGEFAWWMTVITALDAAGQELATSSQMVEQILGAYEIAQQLLEAEKESDYQVQKLVDVMVETAGEAAD